MADVVSIAEARGRAGVRVVAIPGVPSPWTEAAKGLLHVKGVPYVLARPGADEAPDAARAWVGDVGVPAFVVDEERPRTGWAEILLRTERLAPEPALIPANASERALCFGLAHELCGEEGLGWTCRLLMIHTALEQPDVPGFPPEVGAYLAPRYGYTPGCAPAAKRRVLELLGLFSARLDGHRYLMQDRLTALDVYLATFLTLLHPLPSEEMPMSELARAGYTCRDPELLAALAPRLLDHQRFVYERHLELPVQL